MAKRQRPMTAYSQRDHILKKMGYNSYSQYLASPLWRCIRSRVLAGGPDCYACPAKANQAHHGRCERSEQNLPQNSPTIGRATGIVKTEDDGWKALPIARLKLSHTLTQKLIRAKILTLVDLTNWLFSGKILTDIPGVGPRNAEQIRRVSTRFFAD